MSADSNILVVEFYRHAEHPYYDIFELHYNPVDATASIRRYGGGPWCPPWDQMVDMQSAKGQFKDHILQLAEAELQKLALAGGCE
jgi:hypothetical protein